MTPNAGTTKAKKSPKPAAPPLLLKLPRARRPPRAPGHLSGPMRRWWSRVAHDFVLEPHHLLLLTAAAESWDLSQRARAVLAAEGLTYTDRWNQPKPRAEIAVEQGSKVTFMKALRELGLDVAAPEESRPPGLGSGRRRS